MATGQSLIDRAHRLLGQAEPDTTESTDALEACNAMLDSWRNEMGMVYALQEESLTIAASTATRTLGPGGSLVTTRPVAIEAAWIVEDDVSHPVRIVTHAEYAAIPTKTSEAEWPELIAYEGTMANGTIYMWPLANASRTMKLLTRVPLAALTLAGTVSLPPGWEEAITSNLALAIAPEYEASPSDEVVKMARESKANIKRINSRPIVADSGLVGLFGRGSGNILTG